MQTHFYDVRVAPVAGANKFFLRYAGTGAPPEDATASTDTPSPVTALVGGDTYVFRQGHASNAGHPLIFTTGAENSTSVVSDPGAGTPGFAGSQTILPLTTQTLAHADLYLNCAVHPDMGTRYGVWQARLPLPVRLQGRFRSSSARTTHDWPRCRETRRISPPTSRAGRGGYRATPSTRRCTPPSWRTGTPQRRSRPSCGLLRRARAHRFPRAPAGAATLEKVPLRDSLTERYRGQRHPPLGLLRRRLFLTVALCARQFLPYLEELRLLLGLHGGALRRRRIL